GLQVNYRLGAIRSEQQSDGSWRHTIEVFRAGADRGEPVVVQAQDDRGNRLRATWDAPGPRGEVVVVTPGALGGVVIDPDQRLVQSMTGADGNPRGDDATDLPWRPPILNAFAFDAFVTEGLFTGVIDFVLRRRYDLEHTIGLRA